MHIIHRAFKTGAESTNWALKKALKGAFTLLHDSPARRDDYVSPTGSNTYFGQPGRSKIKKLLIN